MKIIVAVLYQDLVRFIERLDRGRETHKYHGACLCPSDAPKKNTTAKVISSKKPVMQNCKIQRRSRKPLLHFGLVVEGPSEIGMMT